MIGVDFIRIGGEVGMSDKELLLERLERLAIVLDELMPQCAELVRDAITMLKEQEVRELTMDEWREWKNNPKKKNEIQYASYGNMILLRCGFLIRTMFTNLRC